MTLELKPEHERIIEQAIQSGKYRDASEVIDQALATLREQRLQARESAHPPEGDTPERKR